MAMASLDRADTRVSGVMVVMVVVVVVVVAVVVMVASQQLQ